MNTAPPESLKFGKFLFQRKIGKGGQGEVFLYRDVER
jgi:hypothetical protein